MGKMQLKMGSSYIWKEKDLLSKYLQQTFRCLLISRVTTGTEISNFLALITFSEFISEMGQESVWIWNKFLCNEGTAFCDLYHLSRWTSNSSYLGSWYMTLSPDIEKPNSISQINPGIFVERKVSTDILYRVSLRHCLVLVISQTNRGHTFFRSQIWLPLVIDHTWLLPLKIFIGDSWFIILRQGV